MARLATIDPNAATGTVKQLFDGPLKNLKVNMLTSLANSPAALEAFAVMHGALGKGTLSAKEREVIALASAQANGCGYCQAAHTAIGKMVGLTDQQTIDARAGTLTDPKLGALTRFVGALIEHRGHVSDGDVRTLRDAGYTEAQHAEVIANYALNVFTNYFNEFNHTEVDFPVPAAV
jgi:uncharacterized peroxidase-related enzyme